MTHVIQRSEKEVSLANSSIVSLHQLHFIAHFFTFPSNSQAVLFTVMLAVITYASNMSMGLAVIGYRWNSRHSPSSPSSIQTLSMASGLHHGSRRHQSLTMEAQASPRWICGGQSGNGTAFSLSISIFPISIIPPMLYTYSFIYH
jgi:hypothetical protein